VRNLLSWQPIAIAPALRLVDQIKERLSQVVKPRPRSAGIAGSYPGSIASWVLAHPKFLECGAINRIGAPIGRLETGEPLPYVLQRQDSSTGFHSKPAGSDPRPETEMLVEQALAWLRSNLAQDGTGCGDRQRVYCIGPAVNLPDLDILASDISAGA